MAAVTPEDPPRVALIGVSGYARIHLDLLEELRGAGRISLDAATVVNAREESKTVESLRSQGCLVYSNYRNMLARHRGAIDLCCIPTGIPWHAPMTMAALAAGANVLVEKPLAPTSREVAAIRAAEKRAGRFVAVGFQDLYGAENQQLKARLLAGEIGPLRRIRCRGLWPRDFSYYARNSWAGRIRQGGRLVFDSPLGNAFSHFLNLALFFSGAAEERSSSVVAAEGCLLRAQPIDNFDTAAVRLRTDAGVEVLFYASHSSRRTFEPELVIEGAAGRVVWNLGRNFRIEPEGRAARSVPLPAASEVRRIMFSRITERLRDPRVLVCGTAIAAEHTRACEIIQGLPIQPVPPAALARSRTADGHKRIWIRGLEGAFSRAWAKGQLLEESGYPWTIKKRKTQLARAGS